MAKDDDEEFDEEKHISDDTEDAEDDSLEMGADSDFVPEKMSNDDSDEPSESLRSIKHLSGLYQKWFVDYASYVILERAVPYINDGLKPVQRRILHSMKELEDGRFNKVANIVGNTMKYHPHGDASIFDALVQLGQKNLLIDCQGNWGNILTGDGASAPRYIEARLSQFALDVVYNSKITEWKPSYDGRNREPVTLPVRFPLLLAQGVEGIAVGLATKVFPHNFNELIDASIAYLKNEEFALFPDFPTGGLIDVSRYNDGMYGGKLKVRARIEKENNKTLKITELPFGRNANSIKESIIKANLKGKIKIKNIDDNTASSVELIINLPAGVSSDKTIDALYAFTDCEMSLAPNACVIEDDKPRFVSVTEILKRSTDDTIRLLRNDLQIQLAELIESLLYASLEKIFIEQRIYKDKEYENGKTLDAIIKHVKNRLVPFVSEFSREITDDDIKRLFEIKMKRIFRFNSDEADTLIKNMKAEADKLKYNIEHIIDYTINYFKRLKERYGVGRERLTEIRTFESIDASKVVIANEKLYINKEDGFVGTALKKDEYICDCSDLDDMIIFKSSGVYYITKVSDKVFVGKDVLYVAIFKKNDRRTIYNVVYADGKAGVSYVKRFSVTGVTRDKEYNITKGKPGSKILHFSANHNGEAETIKVILKAKPTIKKLMFEYDFANLAIKGKDSLGNILTKSEIHKIIVTQKGLSTLGGRMIWFDDDVNRLNTDNRGRLLGEFQGDDKIIVIRQNGWFFTTNFDTENHYEGGYKILEKFKPSRIWTAVVYDAEAGFYYLKRFKFEESPKESCFIPESEDSKLICLSSERHPRFEISFGGSNEGRNDEIIDADDFIGEKSFRAKGKRLTTFEVASIVEIEPRIVEGETEDDEDVSADEEVTNEDGSQEQTSMNFDDNLLDK